MSGLPAEILLTIFSYLSPSKWCRQCDMDGQRDTAAHVDLVNAALVCKTWSNLLSEPLNALDSIFIDSVDTLDYFLTKMKPGKQRSLSVVLGAGLSKPSHSMSAFLIAVRTDDELAPMQTQDLAALLRACPLLDCLHVTVQRHQPSREDRHQSAGHSLTHLSLSLEGPGHTLAEVKDILLEFPRLTSLSLDSNADVICGQHRGAHRFGRAALPFDGVRAHLPLLEKLNLGMTGACSQRRPLEHLLSPETWAAVAHFTSRHYMSHMFDLGVTSLLQRSLRTLKIVHEPGDENNWLDLAFIRGFEQLTKIDLVEAGETFEIDEVLPVIDLNVEELSFACTLDHIYEPIPLPNRSRLKRLLLRYNGELDPDQAARWNQLSIQLAECGATLVRWEAE